MKLPRFSIRSGLKAIAGFAVLFVVARDATRGEYWAQGLLVCVGILGLIALVHPATFLLAALVNRLLTGAAPQKPTAPASPVGEA